MVNIGHVSIVSIRLNVSCIQQDCGDGLVKKVVQTFSTGQDAKQTDNHPAIGFHVPDAIEPRMRGCV
jgi:hypothetical protein